ncbi:hypothetical protein K523DRAFT_411388 [Schizophyllum commune Tattone D]|nr:hypothetical protein K523DRAFT_411388 [Schizophyllum commune Tattone D]
MHNPGSGPPGNPSATDCGLTPLSLGIPEPKFYPVETPPPAPGFFSLFALPGTPPEAGSSLTSPCLEAGIPPDHQFRWYQPNPDKFGNRHGSVGDILTYKLWLFMYQTVLFRMPVFYYGRVSRVLEDADMSMAEVYKLARTTTAEWAAKGFEERKEALERLRRISNWTMVPQHASNWVTPAMERFKDSWESFINSLLREWKTQNIISALLMSGLMSMLQIDAASSDVVTRTLCLLALIAALMSLLYGCLYIIRFGTMKRMHKAAAWADEAQKRRDSILWNVWVLLAMPTVWLICIMSYVWRTSHVAGDDDSTDADHSGRAARIVISCMVGLGIIYLCLVIKTFARYGDRMDRSYKQRVQAMVQQILPNGTTYSDYGVITTNKQVTERSPQISTPASQDRPPTPEILPPRREEERQEERAHHMSPSLGHRFSQSDTPLSGSRLSRFLRDDAEVYSSDEDGEGRWSDSASMQPEFLSEPTLITNLFEDSFAYNYPMFLGTDANAFITTTSHGDTPRPPVDMLELEGVATGASETSARFRRSTASPPQSADHGITEGLASFSDVVNEPPAVDQASSAAIAGRHRTFDDPENERNLSSNPFRPLRGSMSLDGIWRPAEADIAPVSAGGQQTSKRLPTLEEADETLLSRRPASGPRVGFRRSRSMEW